MPFGVVVSSCGAFVLGMVTLSGDVVGIAGFFVSVALLAGGGVNVPISSNNPSILSNSLSLVGGVCLVGGCGAGFVCGAAFLLHIDF